MGKACKNCEFYDEINPEEDGYCCYNPPIVITGEHGSLRTTFPIVSEDQWCGKYKGKMTKVYIDEED